MSDINTPSSRQHPEEPAEGPDDESAEPNRTADADSDADTDDFAPDEDMSSYNIQPPPTEDSAVPGVPDASDALQGQESDEPGANATGVGI
ncbi:hypothetical protein [Agromyces ramosus]|uniref:Uncharacterized protein n=1 Tax=Agromyces ramosus TaxID=33879 RepID=A0ABU0R8G5_9MICO|nr:hypothetical protein [Agromyces ramosus]MDQ0894360.1 hypothetical protein [Agromyces ramosus]